ncbi:MAG: hypothetical protein AABX28_01675 [Nanoarchaeota archaeon]
MKEEGYPDNPSAGIVASATTSVSWAFTNFVVAVALRGWVSDDTSYLYLLADLGANTVDGFYNLYRSKRDKIAKKNLSNLEELVDRGSFE